MNLKELIPLLESIAPPSLAEELGRIGEIEPQSSQEFASFISKKLDTHVQYTGDGKIRKVMLISLLSK